MLAHLHAHSPRFKFFLLISLLLIAGTVIFAAWKRPVEVQGEQSSNRLEAEIVTVSPTGFEPGMHDTLEAIALQIDGAQTFSEAHDAAAAGGYPGIGMRPGTRPEVTRTHPTVSYYGQFQVANGGSKLNIRINLQESLSTKFSAPDHK